MEKFVCEYCNVIYSGKVRKLTERQLELIKEIKERIEKKHQEFLERRLTLSSWEIFRGFFDMEIEYLKTNDFDSWLFKIDEKSWQKKQDYKYLKDKTHFHQCPTCKRNKFLSL